MENLKENLFEIYNRTYKFPWGGKDSSFQPLVDVEIDGKHSAHKILEDYEIRRKMLQAQEYFSIHISKGVYLKWKKIERDKPYFENFIVDIDASNLKSSYIILKRTIKLLENSGLIQDVDFFVKYSGNKGFHLIIPYWKLQNIDRELFTLWFIVKMKGYREFLDLNLLKSKHHMIRDFWTYNPKGNLISIYIDKDTLPLLDKQIDTIKKLADSNNVSEIISLSELLSKNINYKEVNFTEDFFKNLKLIEMKRDTLKGLLDFTKNLNKKQTKKSKLKAYGSAIIIGNKKIVMPKKCREAFLKGVVDGKKRFLFVLLAYAKTYDLTFEEFKQIVKDWVSRCDIDKDFERHLKYNLEYLKRNWDRLPKYKPPKLTSEYCNIQIKE